ncbi:hypothetical protein C8R45DRAFT_938729 [Mycena sanguinolenta]|nr:hypothetical protein C8R45DRAFT_938729 [Mycena sanguinolenta]
MIQWVSSVTASEIEIEIEIEPSALYTPSHPISRYNTCVPRAVTRNSQTETYIPHYTHREKGHETHAMSPTQDSLPIVGRKERTPSLLGLLSPAPPSFPFLPLSARTSQPKDGTQDGAGTLESARTTIRTQTQTQLNQTQKPEPAAQASGGGSWIRRGLCPGRCGREGREGREERRGREGTDEGRERDERRKTRDERQQEMRDERRETTRDVRRRET